MNDPSSTQDHPLDNLVGELAEEFLEGLRRGEKPTAEEYAQRHPEAAELIRQVFPSLEVMGETEIHRTNTSPSESDDKLGVIGDYRIIGEIGRGGMGVVYEAHQLSLDRRVALKVLPFAAVLDARQIKRFQNEARAAAQLKHPNIVQVFGVGCERSVHFYAMEFVEGETLAKIITDLQHLEGVKDIAVHKGSLACNMVSGQFESSATSTTVPENEGKDESSNKISVSTMPSSRSKAYFRNVAQIGTQVAEALDHAHHEGVIHRDIKPSNLMLDAQGKAWVTDFGLARIESDAGMTMTGDLVGTLRYMSPEQAMAKRVVVDYRTDIYSLGVTLYEMLALCPAFPQTNQQELLKQIAFDEPPRLTRINRKMPADLETIILKAIEKNPSGRYETASEFSKDLKRFLDDEPIHAKRPSSAQIVAKWAKRHTSAVYWTAAALFSFTVLSVIGLAYLSKQVTEKNEALQEAENKTHLSDSMRLASESRELLNEDRHAALDLAIQSQMHLMNVMDQQESTKEMELSMKALNSVLEVTNQGREDRLLNNYTVGSSFDIESLNLLSHTGKWLVAQSLTGDVLLWNLERKGNLTADILCAPGGEVVTVAFSPNDRWLICYSKSRQARLYSLDGVESLQRSRGFDLSVPEVVIDYHIFAADGKGMVTCSEMGVRSWDLSGAKPTSLVLYWSSNNQRKALVAQFINDVLVVDAPNGIQNWQYPITSKNSTPLTLPMSGLRLGAGPDDTQSQHYVTTYGRRYWRLHNSWLTDSKNNLRMFEPRQGWLLVHQPIEEVKTASSTDRVGEIGRDPEYGTAPDYWRVLLLDLKDTKADPIVLLEKVSMCEAHFSGNGKRIVCSYTDDNNRPVIKLFDLSSVKLLGRRSVEEKLISAGRNDRDNYSVDIDDLGENIFLQSKGDLIVFNVESMKNEPKQYVFNILRGNDFSFSSQKDHHVISAIRRSSGKGAIIDFTETKHANVPEERYFEFFAGSQPFFCNQQKLLIHQSSDGRSLLGIGVDRTNDKLLVSHPRRILAFFQLPDGSQIISWDGKELKRTLVAGGDRQKAIESASFNYRSTWIAGSSQDGQTIVFAAEAAQCLVRIVEGKSGEWLRQVIPLTFSLRSLAVAPDGRIVVVVTANGQIKVLDFSEGLDHPKQSEISIPSSDSQSNLVAVIAQGSRPRIIVASGSMLYIYPLRDGSLDVEDMSKQRCDGFKIEDLLVSPDGDWLLLRGDTGESFVVELDNSSAKLITWKTRIDSSTPLGKPASRTRVDVDHRTTPRWNTNLRASLQSSITVNDEEGSPRNVKPTVRMTFTEQDPQMLSFGTHPHISTKCALFTHPSGSGVLSILPEKQEPFMLSNSASSGRIQPGAEQYALLTHSSTKQIFVLDIKSQTTAHDLGRGANPVWSEDGTQIWYHNLVTNTIVQRMLGDSTTMKIVFTLPADTRYAVVSPDGKSVAYVTDYDSVRIAIIPSGEVMCTWPLFGAQSITLDWSRDSQSLLLSSTGTGNFTGLWCLHPKRGDGQLLAAGNVADATWSLDNGSIAFTTPWTKAPAIWVVDSDGIGNLEHESPPLRTRFLAIYRRALDESPPELSSQKRAIVHQMLLFSDTLVGNTLQISQSINALELASRFPDQVAESHFLTKFVSRALELSHQAESVGDIELGIRVTNVAEQILSHHISKSHFNTYNYACILGRLHNFAELEGRNEDALNLEKRAFAMLKEANRLGYNISNWSSDRDLMSLIGKNNEMIEKPWASILRDGGHLERRRGEALLSFENYRIRGKQLKQLKMHGLSQIPALRRLNVSDMPVTDEFLKRLEIKQKKLKFLDCGYTQITNVGLQSIRGFEELDCLVLDRTEITSDSADVVASLLGLRTLSLGDTKIDDGFIKRISKLPSLEHIFLHGTRITDESTRDLAALPKLNFVYLADTDVSNEAAAWLTQESSTLTVAPQQPQRHSKQGAALYFDGANSFVDVPSLAYPGETPITIEAWVLPLKICAKEVSLTAFANSQVFVSIAQAAGVELACRPRNFEFRVNDDARGRQYINVISKDVRTIRTVGDPMVHLAGVFDPDSGIVTLFVDGIKMEQNHVRRFKPSRLAFSLGVNPNWCGQDEYLHGYMDEIRISGEAIYLDNFTPARRLETLESTWALYHCDGGHGTILKDDSGHGHDGRMIGVVWCDEQDLAKSDESKASGL
jgi:serine/threonine protein kinase